MSRKWKRVDFPDWPGPKLWLMVDEPHADWGSRDWPALDGMTSTKASLVHLISDHAGGEIRAYLLTEDGRIFLRDPKPMTWSVMDLAVCAALGVDPPAEWKPTDTRKPRCPGGQCACHGWDDGQGYLFRDERQP